ncbi:hypothetical protein [Halomonas sp. KRD171]|uniref:hypothetical protein n=1 Tax=Halomonas sp. KRD171 TaxID=2729726 RepID=UPI0019D2284A|nr:hypothetical protein [Halomonas sp. KRD171]
MNTLDDLDDARKDQEKWGTAFANDRSNNPNKYQAQRRDAASKIRRIELYLKDEGVIPKTDQELLDEELDQLYPNAKPKRIVVHNGNKYQVRYFPLVQSRSRKTVKEWGHKWVEVS